MAQDFDLVRFVREIAGLGILRRTALGTEFLALAQEFLGTAVAAIPEHLIGAVPGHGGSARLIHIHNAGACRCQSVTC